MLLLPLVSPHATAVTAASHCYRWCHRHPLPSVSPSPPLNPLGTIVTSHAPPITVAPTCASRCRQSPPPLLSSSPSHLLPPTDATSSLPADVVVGLSATTVVVGYRRFPPSGCCSPQASSPSPLLHHCHLSPPHHPVRCPLPPPRLRICLQSLLSMSLLDITVVSLKPPPPCVSPVTAASSFPPLYSSLSDKPPLRPPPLLSLGAAPLSPVITVAELHCFCRKLRQSATVAVLFSPSLPRHHHCHLRKRPLLSPAPSATALSLGATVVLVKSRLSRPPTVVLPPREHA